MSIIGKSKEEFDREFVSGRWDYLDSIDEIGHYSAIVDYVRLYYNNPKILDVGCGQGILLKQFMTGDYSIYHGIDFSKEAIKLCEKYSNPAVRLFYSDISDFHTENNYDLIIFCESLSYFKDISEILLKYVQFLNDSGKLIISCYDEPVTHSFWEQIPKGFNLLSSTEISNKRGLKWNVKLFEMMNNNDK